MSIVHYFLLPIRIRCYLNLYKIKPKKLIDYELVEALQYFINNPITVFPYDFIKEYQNLEIPIFDEGGSKYFLYSEKKLFIKPHWNNVKAIAYAKSILIEQDELSPHLYLTDNFKVEPDEVVVDIGVAEGNFSLSVVDKVKKILMFESDKGWVDTLHKTFEPYKDKVEIINKKVSSINDESSVALDSFQYLKDEKLFIKIDVEGAEAKVLNGMKKLLTDCRSIKVVVCTYHKNKDAK